MYTQFVRCGALAAAAAGQRLFGKAVQHQQQREVGTLLLAELRPDSTGLASCTLNTLTAAQALGQPITALVAGASTGSGVAISAAASLQGVSQVLVAEHAGLQLPEGLAALVQALQSKLKFDYVVAPASSWGKAVLPRLGALLGVQPVADVTRVVDGNTFVRPIYAGNALATVKYAPSAIPDGAPRIITVRPSAFPLASTPAGAQPAPVHPAPAEALAVVDAAVGRSQLLSRELTKSDRPELASAKVVVCGGRALKSADNFKMLESLADALGGAVGASRAAVDAGMVPNDLQIGQTGKVIAPALYIGVGISGAIQHLAGIKDAGTIVAINNNPEAEIFQVADLGLVEDLFKAVPELEQAVRSTKAA